MIDGQKAQGDMNELKPIMTTIEFEAPSRISGGKPLNDNKSSVVTLSDITVLDGRPWANLKV